jgi:hypothetical protein
MTKKTENDKPRLPTLLAAIAAVATMAAGCGADLPTGAVESVADDCYLVNGQWHCPHTN